MSSPGQKSAKTGWRILLEYGVVLIGAILIAQFLRTYVIETFRMPSRSMTPTVQPGDTLFVNKWLWRSKRRSEPRLGEVVVFEFESEPGRNYIKRIVGLPGDKIKVRKGSLIRNGVNVTQKGKTEDQLCVPEVLNAIKQYTVCIEEPELSFEDEVIVPVGYAFVLGDLRSLTQEIRKPKTHGLVPFYLINGTAWVIWLSVQPAAPGSGFSRIEFSRMFRGIQ